jgi:sugar phosphate isomerase/epimerase
MHLSRREFMGRTLLASSAITFSGAKAIAANQPQKNSPPIVVFSKVYQELKLDFQEAASITAEAGLDGIDCPVRPGGEILPERADEDLPRHFEILRRNNLQLPLLTTAITSASSPRAESVLRLAQKLGVMFYRLGFIDRKKDMAQNDQVREVQAQLKDLVALNKEIGIGGLLQNHSPSGSTIYFGGNLDELQQTVEGFDPAQLGIAFDIGHALVVHGDNWRAKFEKLRSHFKIAYIKDVTRSGNWVPFGRGDIASTGYFSLLKKMHYQAPISLHMEYDWTENGKAKNRESLLAALRDSSRILRQWLHSE